MLKTGFGTLVVIFDLKKERKKETKCALQYLLHKELAAAALTCFLFVFAFDWLSICVFGFPLAHP